MIEEFGVGHFAIGAHLLLVFVGDFGIELAGALLGAFARRHTHRAILAQVAEGGGGLSEIAELERALAEPAAGHHADGVGHAAIDFDEGDEAFAVGAGRVFEAEQSDAIERHAQAENLAGAEVAVRLGGEQFVFGERLQGI